MRLAPIKDHANLVKDLDTGAVLTVDSIEIERARARKEKRRKEKEEISQLKQDVADIKEMLSLLANKIGSQ